MSIQILNCASMSPWWPRWHIGGVCLLVDTDQGPVLVDTGLGLHDHEDPSRLVRFFRMDMGIPYAPWETAVRRVAARGIPPETVHHIVLTHLHFDHAGGLPDFPSARIHLHRKEYEALQHPKKWIERFAYDRKDFEHGPDWVLYEHATEKWFDFDAIPLPFSPRMFLIPLFGHTSGHCGVAVEDGAGWVFACGDALPIVGDYKIPDRVKQIMVGSHFNVLERFADSHPQVRMLAGHDWKTEFDEGVQT